MPVTHHLLLVDSDGDRRQSLAEQLAFSEEFLVVQSACAAQATQKAQRERVDLAILDAGEPGPEGSEAVRRMRRSGFRSPVIMLGESGPDASVILGLEAGANDYVIKPFSVVVLLARIRAQLRQYASNEDAVFQIGPYSFRPGANLLIKDNGSRLKLTEKETAIIRLLIRAGQKLVSREKLLTEVWGYHASVATHTLETHVYRLRRKLASSPSAARLIVTERGGYRLVQ
jgi:DNA-binding response OmpR family regulator